MRPPVDRRANNDDYYPIQKTNSHGVISHGVMGIHRHLWLCRLRELRVPSESCPRRLMVESIVFLCGRSGNGLGLTVLMIFYESRGIWRQRDLAHFFICSKAETPLALERRILLIEFPVAEREGF